MKIDTSTVAILKNFAKINPSILIQEGNVIKTISTSKTIMAKAKLSQNFDHKFAVYNLDRFISSLSLFNEPDLVFKDKFVTITDGDKKINYTYADESTIIKAPDKEISLPSVDVEFTLTHEVFKDVEKGLSVLGLPEIVIVGDGAKIFIQASDSKNPSGDVYSVMIGETDKNFRAIFKSENIKVLPGDYQVSISAAGISLFKSEVAEYFIAVESTSTFGA